MALYHTHVQRYTTRNRRLHKLTRFAVVGDVLHREIDDNEKLLIHTPTMALGIPVDALLSAERQGVRWVILTDEHGRRLRAPLAAWWRPPAFVVDRGYGTQRALPLSAMQDANAPFPAAQGGLFE